MARLRAIRWCSGPVLRVARVARRVVAISTFLAKPAAARLCTARRTAAVGVGGRSVFGSGGAQSGTEAAGNAGALYGGGGGGAHTAGDTDRSGGAGAAGVIYAIEFLA